MECLDAIFTRRSIRKFKSDPVEKETLEKIIKAGGYAATGNNVQPWKFVVITDADMRKKVKDLCPKNGPYIEFAPVCIAVFCDKASHPVEDGSAATQNIMLAGHAHGLGSCWIAGDKKDYTETVRELLNVPKHYRLVSLISMGYPAADIPNKTKKPLEEALCKEIYQP